LGFCQAIIGCEEKKMKYALAGNIFLRKSSTKAFAICLIQYEKKAFFVPNTTTADCTDHVFADECAAGVLSSGGRR